MERRLEKVVEETRKYPKEFDEAFNLGLHGTCKKSVTHEVLYEYVVESENFEEQVRKYFSDDGINYETINSDSKRSEKEDKEKWKR